MKRKIMIGMASLLTLALMVWAFMPRPAEVEIAIVTLGRFERSVQEDGKTRLRDRYVVSTPLMGRVARIDLKQGDAVEMGATVATLWPVSPALLDERSRAEQVAHTGAMQASVAKTQANMERAKAALDQASAELKRSEKLATQGFISPNQNETGRLNVRLREKELESARHEGAATRYELEQSRIALKRFFQSAPSTQETQKRAFVIKSPVSGRVLKVVTQSEGIVMAGTPLLELGDATQLEVVLDILTEDAAQIKPGSVAQLSNWGGPDVLLGQVRLIEPAAFNQSIRFRGRGATCKHNH